MPPTLMQDINRKPSLKERTETWLSSDKPEYLLDATSTREELAGELEAWLRRRFDFNHRFLAHWRALGVGETVVEILKRVCREGGYRDEEERARIAKLAREIHLRTYNEVNVPGKCVVGGCVLTGLLPVLASHCRVDGIGRGGLLLARVAGLPA